MRLRQEIVNKFCELFPEDADVMSSPEYVLFSICNCDILLFFKITRFMNDM